MQVKNYEISSGQCVLRHPLSTAAMMSVKQVNFLKHNGIDGSLTVFEMLWIEPMNCPPYCAKDFSGFLNNNNI
jgi:hypothetical protein